MLMNSCGGGGGGADKSLLVGIMKRNKEKGKETKAIKCGEEPGPVHGEVSQ